jgi:CRP/FNR family transcriptional regulator, cyclic AMP receptor protein
MFNLEQIKDGVLKRFMIQIPAGTTLFKQNDKGNTLYIVVEGSVKLTHKIAQSERVIATLGPGEIVGEKALCVSTPYRRAFTAIADTESVALEFDAQSLKAIATKIPDFSLKLLQVVVERLDRANALIGVLQTHNSVERVAQYLMYLCEYHSKPSGEGMEISVTAESIHTALNIDLETVSECLNELIAEKVIVQRDAGFFISDENALTQHLSILKTRYAA